MATRHTRLRNDKLRLMLVLALLLGAGFMATTLISYFAARNVARQTIVATELPLTSDTVFSEIQKDLVRPILIASMMSRDTFLRDWVVSGEKTAPAMARYLQEVQTHYGAVTAFFVSEATRRYYQAGQPNGVLKTVSPAEPRDAWYFRVRGQSDLFEINVDPDMANRDRLTIFINYRVFDYARRFVGVTGVGLEVDSVLRTLADHQQRFDRRIYFVDDKGRVVLTAKSAAAGSRPSDERIQDMPGLRDLADDILLAHKGTFEYQAGGRRRYLNVRYIPELKWHLFVEQEEPGGFTGMRRVLLANVLVCLAISLAVMALVYWAVSRYQRPLERMATTDSLTGLSNRHALDVLLQQGALESTRLGISMCAVLLDIDHFKALNDRLGHLAGDQILGDVGLTLRTNLRNSDIACRWGGEEFLVILKNADLDEAVRIAENLRSEIGQRQHGSEGNTVAITISAGVAAYRSGESHESFLARTDAALYRAKHDGRNRVCQELPGDSGVAPLMA